MTNPTKPDTGTAHTPGEWTAEEYASPKGRWFVRANGKMVNYPLNEADARLIAAAPNMLTALKELVLSLDGRVHSNPALNALYDAKDAIAKAEGRQP